MKTANDCSADLRAALLERADAWDAYADESYNAGEWREEHYAREKRLFASAIRFALSDVESGDSLDEAFLARFKRFSAGRGQDEEHGESLVKSAYEYVESNIHYNSELERRIDGMEVDLARQTPEARSAWESVVDMATRCAFKPSDRGEATFALAFLSWLRSPGEETWNGVVSRIGGTGAVERIGSDKLAEAIRNWGFARDGGGAAEAVAA